MNIYHIVDSFLRILVPYSHLKMNDILNNSICLKDRLIQSSKTTHKNPMLQFPFPGLPPPITIVDNKTNEPPSSSRYSDNVSNNVTFNPLDTNNTKYETINNTNHIQKVPSIEVLTSHRIKI